SVDVGIRHDYDAVVAKLVEVQRFGVVFGTHAHAEGGKHVLDFLVFVDLVFHRLFHVEDFTAQRQYRLEFTVASLFGRPSGGVPFHEVYFTFGGVVVGAVGQFARQSAAAHHALTLYEVAGFAGGCARL